MREKKNQDIRKYASKRGVRQWEIAERLGYSCDTLFTVALRRELPEDKKAEIFRIIDELAQE